MHKAETCDRDDGLPILTGDNLRVIRHLDGAILTWALGRGAREIGFPPLTAVAELDRIDYFENFPQLGLAVAPLRREVLSSVATEKGAPSESMPSCLLDGAEYFLPSAACYPIYAYMRDRVLTAPVCITTVQRCFRNETRYQALTRLRAFTMREIVFIGTHEDVARSLALHKDWIVRLSHGIDLSLDIRVATDPFFEPEGRRAQMQRFFPVKEEFVFDGSVAVASVNSHRNFFAERWNICAPDKTHAFSGCVAFGLERWLYAISRRYQDDVDRMVASIDAGASYATCSVASDGAAGPDAGSPRALS